MASKTKKTGLFWKRSLKYKLSLILIGMVLLISLLSILMSNLLLTRYYVYSKNQSLISTYKTIESIYMEGLVSSQDNEDESELSESDAISNSSHRIDMGAYAMDSTISESLHSKLEQISQNRNMAIIVYRDLGTDMFYSLLKGGTKLLLYSSLGKGDNSTVESSNVYSDYINSQDAVVTDNIEESNYTIKQLSVKRLGSDYIYLDGVFENGDKILIRASMAGITESVKWSNRFFIYISFIAAIIGFAFMYFVSNRFVHPITSLTEIARRMAQLDFTAQYNVTTDDEVGILGTSINMLSETLETALSELKTANAELRNDLEKKEQVDEMRKEFLSNVSHELKTPIALIQGYAEGLIDNVNDDPESREFYCEVIVDEAHKMNNMVKQIMALNQLEFGYSKVNMEHFDIVDLIRGVISKSDILFKQKEITLQFDAPDPVYVWSDAYMTEEIFTNYLTNAIHHVSGECRIEISIEKTDSHVKIGVFNTGLPIPETDIDNIWDKFYKVDKARTREYGGSGVGLSIVKASMDLLGQQFGVQNYENGVLFWFNLDSDNTIV